MAKRKASTKAKRPRHISLTPAKALKRFGVTPEWYALLCLIPGYDPYRESGKCRFDVAAADRAVAFFAECLRHGEGEWAGKPFLLEPWQKAIVGSLWGWKRPDGTRRYRECLIYIPRKNGKTTLVAGLALLMLFCDNEPGAQIYSAGSDAEQAGLVFREAVGMIRAEPELETRSEVYGEKSGKKTVYLKDSSSFYRAISAEAKGKHGYNSHGVIVDELHAQPNRELVDVLETSTGARRQPLVIHLTTADYDRESICNTKHDGAKKVRDGIVSDPAFLPVIYEASKDDDWKDEKVWARANPNLGVTIGLDKLRRHCRKAQDEPGYENTFKRLFLNIKTEQAERWLSLDQWDACCPLVGDRGRIAEAAEMRRELEVRLAHRRCFGALDLSSKIDLTAFVLVFPREDEGDNPGYDVLPFFWVPAESADERELKDNVPYSAWQRAGFCKFTGGNVVDYDAIRAEVKAIAAEYEIVKLPYDPYNAQQLATQLAEQDGLPLVEFSQTIANFNEPSKYLEALVRAGKLNHAQNPVLRWMASHVAIYRGGDGNENIRPSKKSSADRIDGIVALIMALGCCIVTGDGRSVYEERGLVGV